MAISEQKTEENIIQSDKEFTEKESLDFPNKDRIQKLIDQGYKIAIVVPSGESGENK